MKEKQLLVKEMRAEQQERARIIIDLKAYESHQKYKVRQQKKVKHEKFIKTN